MVELSEVGTVGIVQCCEGNAEVRGEFDFEEIRVGVYIFFSLRTRNFMAIRINPNISTYRISMTSFMVDLSLYL